jgi:hypothetical protein
MWSSPDPALTANIYCASSLDGVLFRAVAPFWRELRPHDPERLCGLWVMRYSRGGEHLKVRLHGPERYRSLLRETLEGRVNDFIASLPESPIRERSAGGRPPAIDAEDDVDSDHPDPSFLWTTYRRSQISLGGKPFLTDDRYAALFTRCLCAACELVLAQEPAGQGTLPHPVRQRTLLKALIAGFAALGFPVGKRRDYFAYHRDWLLRSVLPKDRRLEPEAIEQLCRRLDEQAATMGSSRLSLRGAAEEEWNGRGARREGGPDAPWRQSLAALLEYVSPLCRDPDYRLDPFAGDPAFAPLFKVFHGLANQLGLKPLDEAFAHHLLQGIANE